MADTGCNINETMTASQGRFTSERSIYFQKRCHHRLAKWRYKGQEWLNPVFIVDFPVGTVDVRVMSRPRVPDSRRLNI